MLRALNRALRDPDHPISKRCGIKPAFAPHVTSRPDFKED
jgi:hypothetical protein